MARTMCIDILMDLCICTFVVGVTITCIIQMRGFVGGCRCIHKLMIGLNIRTVVQTRFTCFNMRPHRAQEIGEFIAKPISS